MIPALRVVFVGAVFLSRLIFPQGALQPNLGGAASSEPVKFRHRLVGRLVRGAGAANVSVVPAQSLPPFV
jgi:hypothetical protein